jgi:hypothetical protein
MSASHPDRGSSLPSLIPDHDATIDLVLVASGGIDGIVEGFSEQLGIVFANGVAEGRSAEVDPSGEFHLDGLPAGEYTLSMPPLPGRTAPASVNVTVVANQRAKAKLVMPKGTVRLIVNVSGDGCAGVSLSAQGDSSSAVSGGLASCSKGRAEFDRVEPGSYRACADQTHCVPVTVGATPDTQTIEIDGR